MSFLCRFFGQTSKTDLRLDRLDLEYGGVGPLRSHGTRFHQGGHVPACGYAISLISSQHTNSQNTV